MSITYTLKDIASSKNPVLIQLVKEPFTVHTTTGAEQLAKDFPRGLDVVDQNGNPILTVGGSIMSAKEAEALANKAFPETEAKLLLDKYSQDPLSPLISAISTTTANSIDDMRKTTPATRKEKLAWDSEKKCIYLEQISTDFSAVSPVDDSIVLIPGTVTTRCDLTKDGFVFTEAVFSHQLLASLFIEDTVSDLKSRVEKECIEKEITDAKKRYELVIANALLGGKQSNLNDFEFLEPAEFKDKKLENLRFGLKALKDENTQLLKSDQPITDSVLKQQQVKLDNLQKQLDEAQIESRVKFSNEITWDIKEKIRTIIKPISEKYKIGATKYNLTIEKTSEDLKKIAVFNNEIELYRKNDADKIGAGLAQQVETLLSSAGIQEIKKNIIIIQNSMQFLHDISGKIDAITEKYSDKNFSLEEYEGALSQLITLTKEISKYQEENKDTIKGEMQENMNHLTAQILGAQLAITKRMSKLDQSDKLKDISNKQKIPLSLNKAQHDLIGRRKARMDDLKDLKKNWHTPEG